jgi:transaldolase/glucose-6-phosphate isomerase
MKPIEALTTEGQSVWLDYIRRDFTRSGALADLVADGVRGVTSNPSIFEKAIGGSAEYDEALAAIVASDPDCSALDVFEALAVVDIREAADVLRTVYDASDGADGFVSLEVSPTLAHDAEGTIRDARRLWGLVDRPNLMIKVPATKPGIAAFEQLTSEGINVNVTLMFSMQHYEDVAQAFVRGLRAAADPSGIASVASFFVSRVDSAVDEQLDAIGTDDAAALRGAAAVANAKLAYRRYQEIFEGERFADLAAQGARPQRVLWASTSTKDEAYSDVKYIEELVGDNTVNTVPPATLDAFVDHGTVTADVVEDDVAAADAAISGLAGVGVDFDAITDKLQVDGVASFAGAFQAMLDTIAAKSRQLLANSVDAQVMALGDLGPAVAATTARWADEEMVDRMWAKDHTVWVEDPQPEIEDRLGWLTLPRTMREHIEDIQWFVKGVRADAFTDVVLLGMGGSSLAPDVFRQAFGSSAGFPRLTVLDSTHPAAVQAVDARIDPATTLFLIASKSGTTIEPLSFLEYFWARVTAVADEPGRHFAAITDPGTPLVDLGRDRSFRKVFETIPDVGGRYSALTHFGLVPAALIGADIEILLDQAVRMAEASALSADSNPGVQLGAALGEAARAGRDKATFVTSASLAGFPDWIEQLVAESTGKDGVGVVPIAGEALGSPDVYGSDRVFVAISLAGEEVGIGALDALEAAGHPVVRIVIDRIEDLTSEMFRAEVAVAAAGAVLRIHPFNQPDVQLAKELARQAMAGELDVVDIPEVRAGDREALADAVMPFLDGLGEGDYLGIQAFIAPTADAATALERIRLRVRDDRRVATTVGFGPRFLHSTGQLHKGGADNGVFLQIVDHFSPEVSVPGTDYTFGTLIAGQADGDYQALVDTGRRVIRVCLGDDVSGGLANLEAMLGGN